MTGPSAIGSENGNPISIRFAPASATTGSNSRVKATSGSPTVTNGMNAFLPCERRLRKRSSIGFMKNVVLASVGA